MLGQGSGSECGWPCHPLHCPPGRRRSRRSGVHSLPERRRWAWARRHDSAQFFRRCFTHPLQRPPAQRSAQMRDRRAEGAEGWARQGPQAPHGRHGSPVPGRGCALPEMRLCASSSANLGGHEGGHAAFRSSSFLCSLRSSMLRYRLASIQFSLVSTASALMRRRQLWALGKMRTT